MSRRNRHRAELSGGPVGATIALPSPPAAEPAAAEMHVRFTEADIVLDHTMHQDGTATLMVADPDGRCSRKIVHFDSLFWRCACGATGRVGRSNDGIPFVNDEVLAHAPGENRS